MVGVAAGKPWPKLISSQTNLRAAVVEEGVEHWAELEVTVTPAAEVRDDGTGSCSGREVAVL